MGPRLLGFADRLQKGFVSKTHNSIKHAKSYLKGLVCAAPNKKNMERMAEAVPDVKYDKLQHFITDSPWEASTVFDDLALRANEVIPNTGTRILVIDESAIEKKGRESVGVGRMWNGRLGKVDNCQVGVHASLGTDGHHVIVNSRLYLPKDWAKDKRRCDKVKIPDEDQVCIPKTAIALDMVIHARELGLSFDVVGMDAGYGKDPSLLRSLDELGETFMADVHSPQMVYAEDPRPHVPTGTPGRRGRQPSKPVSDAKPIEARQLAMAAPSEAWERVRVRQTTKGWLERRFLRIPVWLWDGSETLPMRCILLVREDIERDGSAKLKYSATNAKDSLPTFRLAEMQSQRFWIEDTFRNAKGSVGMADYQTRTWRAWHHHMALVAMALLFMLEERLLHKEEIPLLTCNDIVELLVEALTDPTITEDDIWRQIASRHRQRQASIDSAFRRQAESTDGGFLKNEA